jgi:hypothetical protein
MAASRHREGALMIAQNPLSSVAKMTVAALLVGAVGSVLQVASGVTNAPTIPPGLVAIVAAAGLVAFWRVPWTSVAGAVAGLFNLVVFVVVGGAGRLVEPNPLAAFVGAWLMVPALIVASVAGITGAVRGNARGWSAGDPRRCGVESPGFRGVPECERIEP